MEGAHELIYAVAVARHRKLQLLQVGCLEQPPHEQRVARHVPDQAAEILPLGRRAGAEELSQGVLPRELIPMSVVRDPEGAHEAAEIGRQNDDGYDGRTGSGERSPLRAQHHTARADTDPRPHCLALAYAPISWPIP